MKTFIEIAEQGEALELNVRHFPTPEEQWGEFRLRLARYHFRAGYLIITRVTLGVEQELWIVRDTSSPS